MSVRSSDACWRGCVLGRWRVVSLEGDEAPVTAAGKRGLSNWLLRQLSPGSGGEVKGRRFLHGVLWGPGARLPHIEPKGVKLYTRERYGVISASGRTRPLLESSAENGGVLVVL